MSYTYVLMDVSKRTWNEIAEQLKTAGYAQAFHEEDGVTVLDMHGIALRAEESLFLRAARVSQQPQRRRGRRRGK